MSQLKWLVIYLPSDSRRERHFVHSRSQMVARETKLFMRVSAAIFKMLLQVVADVVGVLGCNLRKISPSGSRRERQF